MIAKIGKYKKSERDYFHSVIYSVILATLMFGFLGYFAVSNWRMNQKRAELLLRLDKLKKEVQILEERNTQLKAGVYQVTQDEYWEEKIREQGYKKPGEEVVVIKQEIEEEKEEEKEQGFWDKLLRKIGF